MQPFEIARPINEGSFVPWIATGPPCVQPVRTFEKAETPIARMGSWTWYQVGWQECPTTFPTTPKTVVMSFTFFRPKRANGARPGRRYAWTGRRTTAAYATRFEPRRFSPGVHERDTA